MVEIKHKNNIIEFKDDKDARRYLSMHPDDFQDVCVICLKEVKKTSDFVGCKYNGANLIAHQYCAIKAIDRGEAIVRDNGEVEIIKAGMSKEYATPDFIACDKVIQFDVIKLMQNEVKEKLGNTYEILGYSVKDGTGRVYLNKVEEE